MVEVEQALDLEVVERRVRGELLGPVEEREDEDHREQDEDDPLHRELGQLLADLGRLAREVLLLLLNQA